MNCEASQMQTADRFKLNLKYKSCYCLLSMETCAGQSPNTIPVFERSGKENLEATVNLA